MTEPLVVDARGQRCPLPVIALARRAKGLAAGTVLVLLATDPAARQDVAAWARLRGHELVSSELVNSRQVSGQHVSTGAGDPDLWRLTVCVGSAASPSPAASS